MDPLILWFQDINKDDLKSVGGKGSSLGEMSQAGVPVPPGFVVTVSAYFKFLEENDLQGTIRESLKGLDYNNSGELSGVANKIRKAFLAANMPQDVIDSIENAYGEMGEGLVAVRSSGTAEDLPEASFAGQQDTFLNISGKEQVVTSVQECWASLFGARAIFYREETGFDHLKVGIAVPIQRMIHSETSGVLFTVEPVSNDGTKMVIEAIHGLGEAIVSGALTPDLYMVEKGSLKITLKKIVKQEWELVRNPEFVPELDDNTIKVDIPADRQDGQKLSDEDLVSLARLGRKIEERYGHPQDIEWAREGDQLYILQSRPITTLGQVPDALKKVTAEVLLTGSAASPGTKGGSARIVDSIDELDSVKDGDVLVTEMTTPDFVPAMKRAVAIVTDKGGRTAHAAIVSRELGLPCVVGTESATSILKSDQIITVDGSQGNVYKGLIEMTQKVSRVRRRIKTNTRMYVNLADPDLADSIAKRNVDGLGLLRAEFVVAHIGEHPRYMLDNGRGQEWSDKLANGILKFVSAFDPRPVVYRTTDFKTNEYKNLKGGEKYEGDEENPMIGYRGASRYINEPDVFHLEAMAIKAVLEKYSNLKVMIPFVRTPEEMASVKKLLEKEGLSRDDGLQLWMMVEVPSNVILLDEFLDVGIDGVSIGSNDLTQLTLGVDRDNAKLESVFDERNAAVMKSLKKVITTANKRGVTSSICGQAPSFYPDLTEKLVEWGVTSVSVSPDMIDQTRDIIARVEKKQGKLPAQDID